MNNETRHTGHHRRPATRRQVFVFDEEIQTIIYPCQRSYHPHFFKDLDYEAFRAQSPQPN